MLRRYELTDEEWNRIAATRERKLMKEAKADGRGPVEKIERKWLIRLLY